MSEWLKEHAWKACVGETLPGVRIPLSPPFKLCRARWGVSGALYLQSATAGLNSLLRLQIVRLACKSGVENWVPRNGNSCRIVTNPHGGIQA
jgi:hypothetical protein